MKRSYNQNGMLEERLENIILNVVRTFQDNVPRMLNNCCKYGWGDVLGTFS